MDDQNRNLILATALSFLVILVWFLLFPPPPPEETPAPAEVAQQQAEPGVAPTPGAAGTGTGAGVVGAVEALGRSPRIDLRTARLEGSISLVGGRIDDLRLLDYHETVDRDSPNVTLLQPAGAPDAYYALYGWSPAGGLSPDAVPGPNTPWRVESGGEALTETTPVTLVWDNGAGLIFRRVMSIDANYMFTVTQSVENLGDAEVRLAPYGIVARHGVPGDLRRFYILHEGVIGVADGTLTETDWSDIPDLPFDAAEQANVLSAPVARDGWIGFTDHYWMSTLAARPGQPFTAVTKYTPATDTFQTDMRLPVMAVAPGATAEISTWLFSGAKEWATIRDYQNDLGIDRFVDAIDWGWFFFLTKPIFMALHYLNQLIGNMGWAIIGLTFIIKALLLPLAYKSYVSMSKMKALQPEMEKIKETAGDDRMKMQQEVMALYKREKVNPAAGCLPILLPILHGSKPSEFKPVYDSPADSYFMICLTRDRKELYGRIDQRVDEMFNLGWMQEVEQLLGTDWESFILEKKIIGYDDIIHYLKDGDQSYDDLVAQIQKRTRNYAKRQMTFWRMLKRQLEEALRQKLDGSDRCCIEEVNLTCIDLHLYIEQLQKRIKSMLVQK